MESILTKAVKSFRPLPGIFVFNVKCLDLTIAEFHVSVPFRGFLFLTTAMTLVFVYMIMTKFPSPSGDFCF